MKNHNVEMKYFCEILNKSLKYILYITPIISFVITTFTLIYNIKILNDFGIKELSLFEFSYEQMFLYVLMTSFVISIIFIIYLSPSFYLIYLPKSKEKTKIDKNTFRAIGFLILAMSISVFYVINNNNSPTMVNVLIAIAISLIPIISMWISIKKNHKDKKNITIFDTIKPSVISLFIFIPIFLFSPVIIQNILINSTGIRLYEYNNYLLYNDKYKNIIEDKNLKIIKNDPMIFEGVQLYSFLNIAIICNKNLDGSTDENKETKENVKKYCINFKSNDIQRLL